MAIKDFFSKFIKKDDNWNMIWRYDWYLNWDDLLRLKLDKENELLSTVLENTKTENSNYQVVEFSDVDITFVRKQTTTGFGITWSVSYQSKSIPIIYYEEYLEPQKEMTKAFWKVTLYGAYFRLKELNFFNLWVKNRESLFWSFSNWFKKNFDECYITRLDYKIDFFKKDEKINIFTIDDIKTKRKDTPIKKFEKWDKLESWSVWSRESKRYLVRWYDKIEDINKKNKLILYWDYFDYKTVHRLEFEFLNHFNKDAKTWEKYKLKDINKLHIKIKKFLDINNNIQIFETKEKIDLSDVSSKIKYTHSTKWYLRGCIDNWINIFDLAFQCYMDLWYDSDKLINDLEISQVMQKNWLMAFETKTAKELYDKISKWK